MSDIKKQFPIFNNRDIHYLDSAATTQKPQEIISEIEKYYSNDNANSGRGTHELSMINKARVETTRKQMAKFLNVSDENTIVFTKNATEGLNILAFGYACNFKEGDEILLAISNHHANIVPWQEIAKRNKLVLKYIYLDKFGNLDYNDFMYKINKRTKIVSISLVVNSTGIIQDFKKIIDYAHKYNVKVILDCAQSILHFKHDFSGWDVDFAVFSGHKFFAAQGVGILYGKKELLNETKPLIYGGDMVDYVEEVEAKYKEVPYKFEGGTQNVSSIITLLTAIEYIEKIGYENIFKIEEKLLRYALFRLSSLDFVEIYYLENVERVAIIPFNVKGVHSHDVSFILDSYNVAVRSGQHCTAPLLDFMGINSCCRASFSIYNTEEDIDELVQGLIKVKEIFGI